MAAFGDRFRGLSEQIERERREIAAEGEARRLIQLVRVNGGTIEAHGDQISIRGYRPDALTVEQLKRAKRELLRLLTEGDGR